MRAFLVAWRSLVSIYNELFLLIGVNLLWWLAGGFFIAAAIILGWPLVEIGGPWWLAPFIAIPAGPATAALANVAHRAARDLHVDRTFFTDGLRQYWRKALGVSALLALGDALLILNILFYISREGSPVQVLSLFFLVLLAYWLSVQIYVFPVLVGIKQPTVLGALKMALMMAFANPLFSALIVVLAGLLSGLSVVLAVLVLVIWPTVVVMLGTHALKLMAEMAGIKPEDGNNAS